MELMELMTMFFLWQPYYISKDQIPTIIFSDFLSDSYFFILMFQSGLKLLKQIFITMRSFELPGVPNKEVIISEIISEHRPVLKF